MNWFIYSILILIFTYLGQFSISRKMSFYYRSLLVIVLAYIIGFGGNVMTDHENYAYFYKNFEGINEFSILNLIGKAGRFEYGFMFLAYIGKFFNLGVPGFLFMIAVLVNSLMVSVLYRFKYPILSILMFVTTAYFSQQANGVRQMIATSIFLFSLQYLENKRIKHYLLCVFVAALFHMGAITLSILALLFYVDLKKNYKKIKLIIFVCWIVSLIGVIGILHFNTVVPVGFLDAYESISQEAGNYRTNFNVFYNAVLILALLGFKKQYIVYFIVFSVGCILLNISMASEFGISIYRYAYYFTPLFCMFSGELLFKGNYYKFTEYVKPLLAIFVLYYVYRLVFLYVLFPEETQIGIEMYPISDFFS